MSLLDRLIAEPPPLRMDGDGVLRVGGTRVTLDTIIGAYLQGATAEEIAQNYPSLRLEDVYATLSYYLKHREEAEAYLRARNELAEEVRKRIDSLWPHPGLRERLLARRDSHR